MARLICLVAVAALCGCRTPPPATGTPPPSSPDAGVDGAGAIVVAPIPDAPPAITDAECGVYVDHVLAIALAAMRGTRADDELPTAEQVATIRGTLIAGAPCRALTRGELDCALAAKDQPALYACAKVATP